MKGDGASRVLLGLSSEEAAARLAEYGPNALPESLPEPWWRRFTRQFKSALIYLLLFAVAVDLVVWVFEGAAGLPFEAIAIGAILLLNAGLGTWQEHRAENALKKLQELTTPQTWVMRDGSLERLPADQIVPGDILRVEEGKRVAADGEARRLAGLLVDESPLTGESVPVGKSDGDELFSGTLVVRGSGYVEVTHTGATSAMGKIAGMLGAICVDPTPLEQRLKVFGQRVAQWVFGLAAVLLVVGALVEGTAHLDEVFIFAVALAVAAVPEGLPAVLTVALSLGVERMSTRNAVVRRLAAVESLGSVTVIATDKTGTLTENRMVVQELDAPNPEMTLRAIVVANDADVTTGAGDPLDRGLLDYARSEGVDALRLRETTPRTASRPFDSAWKFMRATVTEDGRAVSYLKGAPEIILARSSLPSEERELWLRRIDEHARGGYRLLGFAKGAGEDEENLEWLGVALLWDPPRPEVPDAIRSAQAAGVRVIMVTGDHPATAGAVALKLGIGDGTVVTGEELDGKSAVELKELTRRVDVFARVSPSHKLALVDALKADGQVVAMTGDGVNDAPALKRADVGVAMGQRGTDVSREVADLVLLDDNFKTIVAAIEEGRNIYSNIQSFIRFLFSTNVALVVLVTGGIAAAALFGLREAGGAILVPLTAAQLLWINIIADGPPALALGLDRNPDVMSQPPRDPAAPLFDALSIRFVLLTGFVKAALGLGVGAALWLLHEGPTVTRTGVFLFEALAQLAFAYPSRRLGSQPRPNRVLNWIVATSVVVQVGIVYFPWFYRLLGIASLDLRAWMGVILAVGVAFGAAQLYTAVANSASASQNHR